MNRPFSAPTMRYYFTSSTRISNLPDRPFEILPLPRDVWAMGDYVAAEVRDASGLNHIELPSGRMIYLAEGDLVIGAFGTRYATMEATGSWEDIGAEGDMHLLTGGGLLGKVRSRSEWIPPLTELAYRGHVFIGGKNQTMQDYVQPVPPRPYDIPTILLIGTSMSAGKTTAGRIIVRQLVQMGVSVVAGKLTGAGRFRDVLSMYDAGADAIFDFVDVGLPSTVCPEPLFRQALPGLLARISGSGADVAVIEVGASPMEPYNGTVAIEAIEQQVRLLVLCASDPYAVLGVMTAFGTRPDLVTGVATNTEAGIQLIERLANVPAMNVRDRHTLPALREILCEKLELAGRPMIM